VVVVVVGLVVGQKRPTPTTNHSTLLQRSTTFIRRKIFASSIARG